MPTCNGAEKAEGGRVVCGGVLVDHALAGGHRNRYGQCYRFVELSPERKYFFVMFVLRKRVDENIEL